jgi:hypothetical protein
MRIKTAIELSKKKAERECGVELVQELSRVRTEIITNKINELSTHGVVREFKTLVAYFDTLTSGNERLKVYQMGMEKIIKQLTLE